ncbi:hypothetical protein CBL_01335 [Carabus blaptoides fortunei]
MCTNACMYLTAPHTDRLLKKKNASGFRVNHEIPMHRLRRNGFVEVPNYLQSRSQISGRQWSCSTKWERERVAGGGPLRQDEGAVSERRRYGGGGIVRYPCRAHPSRITYRPPRY